MSKQEKIVRKQNERSMLEYQYAARYYYNHAEKLSALAFLFAFFSVLSMMLPEQKNNDWSCFLIGFPIVCDAISILLYYFMGKDVQTAALLRNYFDAVILDIDVNEYTDSLKRNIKDLTKLAIKKYINYATVQIANTGRDNPPGVKDWYEFSKNYSDIEVVHECQRQNVWWNRKQLKFRTIVNAILLIVVLIILGLCINHGIELWRVGICAVSFIITFFDRIVNNIKYILVSKEIDGMSENVDFYGNVKQIANLQKHIADRRKIPILGINILHQITNKRLSERYASMTKD